MFNYTFNLQAHCDTDTLRAAQNIALNANTVTDCINALLDNEKTRALFSAVPAGAEKCYNPIEHLARALMFFAHNENRNDYSAWQVAFNYLWAGALAQLCGDKGGITRAVETITKAEYGYNANDIYVSPIDKPDMIANNETRVEIGCAGKSFPAVGCFDDCANHFEFFVYYAIGANEIIAEMVDDNMGWLCDADHFMLWYQTTITNRRVVMHATQIARWVELAENEYFETTGRAKKLARIVNANTRDRKTGEMHTTRAKNDYLQIRGENKASTDALYMAGLAVGDVYLP